MPDLPETVTVHALGGSVVVARQSRNNRDGMSITPTRSGSQFCVQVENVYGFAPTIEAAAVECGKNVDAIAARFATKVPADPPEGEALFAWARGTGRWMGVSPGKWLQGQLFYTTAEAIPLMQAQWREAQG